MSAANLSLPARVRREGTGRALLMLVVFLAISFAVAAFGSLSTLSNVDGWYADAQKPFWNPPNFLFGPVWTVLYTLMSVAAWLVWLRRDQAGARPALWTYVVQLVLNAVWTPAFFGAYPLIGPAALWIALGIILALDVAILLTMLRFWPISRAAAWLLVPYWAWVLFATTLNAGLAVLNS
ncbi:TspO/MBR family protein [Lysobacter korlensis]|uniref:TspO/MBR family protein n=1 Tax=Lysobacter korlensis TaxID=553636 RepID=A0ABV6RTZ8_9GAMM